MKRILINGDRACLPIDGMNRVTLEVTKSLDALVANDDYEIVIPANVNTEFYDRIKDLRNIKIRKTKFQYFRFWTLLFVDVAALFGRRKIINFANRNAVFGGGINFLHDIIPLRFYKNQNKKYLRRIHRLLNTSECLIVPSCYTKKDIEKTMHCKCQIEVVHLGWQHYPQILEDDAVFGEFPQLKKGEYFYSISSISPHKNFRFIYEAAKENPESVFVITGGMNRGHGFEYKELSNLIFTGRISDQKAKALMKNCKAFIFPSLYEGAGLPPLEALSCGVPVLVSDLEVLHEYCGEAVHYFDSENYNLDLQKLLESKVSDSKDMLEKISWDKTAQELKNIIEKRTGV